MESDGLEDAGALRGLKVLDLTHMLSGPYCTWLLGALGAEVIKIERPGAGDFTRGVAPFVDDDESIYFLSVNRNKRSLTLNLKEPRGKEIFRALAADADIIVENNRAGVMDRLQLGYADIAAINPGIVYASISGFGQDGPYRNKPAFDVIAQALSGMMSITGETDRGPARVGASIGDIGASLFATIGILSSLQARHRTGKGSYVDVAMLDCQLAIMENAVARYAITGEMPRRLGSRHPLIAPFQSFPCADEPIAVCVDTQEQWVRLCHALGLPHLITDPRFPTGSHRSARHAELEPLLDAVFRTRRRDAWLTILDEADVPSSPVNTVGEALDDPQVRHRRMVSEVPAGSGRKFVRLPIHTPGQAGAAERPAPALGEHTGAILGGLGYDAGQIEELRRAGIV